MKCSFNIAAGRAVTDYQVQGPIIFKPGSSAAVNSTQCFIVDIINDEIVEATETFILKLAMESGIGTILGIHQEVELTINDDLTDGRFNNHLT